MKTKKELPAWFILTVICLAAALALGATYNGTKDRIATQEAEKAVAVRQELLPEAESFELIEPAGEQDVYRGVAGGKDVGYVSVGTVTGFGGPVEVTVGVDDAGVITGVRVGGANFSETAGLGAKSKEPKFYEQFTGKAYPVELTKNGGEIDAITAATITSSAVVRGVNATIKAMSEAAGFTISEPVALVDELGNNRYATTKQGFGGPVYVELEIVDGAITDIVIGDDSFNETPGYGAGAKEEKFYGQYIGKSGTGLVLNSDIDQVSGATITSTAVNDAVNLILLYVNDPEAFAAQTAGDAEEIDVSIPEGAETWSATGKGLTGTFEVTISVDETGAVNGIAVGEASTAEDAAFLGRVSGSTEFLAQFIGAVPPVESVDTVAGATVSSKGVLAAVNEAYNSYLGIEDTPQPAATEAPADEAEGTKVIAKGLTGSFAVTVTFNEDGTIADVKIGASDSDMDESFLAMTRTDAFLGQFIGKALPVEADTVSGATISSKAIIEAVNSLAPAKEAAAEAADAQKVIAKGLTGSFAVTVTFNEDGTIADVKIGASDSDMDESFLAMTRTDAFLGQFIGKALPVEADTVSGATISSKAIIEAVNSLAPAKEAAAEAADAQKVIAKGLTGSFAVTVTLNEDGTVADVKIGASDSDMDESFLAMTRTETFLSQFIGKSIPVEADTVTGATISSKAIIEAVNSLAPAKEAAAEAADAQKVIAKGLTGSFAVTVTFNEDGTIADVKIGASDSDMDEGFLAMTRTETFLSQFIGKSIPVEADTVTGATISSKAIIEAINGMTPATEAAPEDAAEAVPEIVDTQKVVAKGLTGSFAVTVDFAADGSIVDVKISASDSDMDESFLAMTRTDAFLGQFIGKSIPVEADTVSGATISSKAIIEAINSMTPALASAEEKGAAAEPQKVIAKGLTGSFAVTVTFAEDGTVTDVKISASDSDMDESFLAMTRTDAFLGQFIGKSIPVEADTVSGATVSSKAIIEAINGLAQ